MAMNQEKRKKRQQEKKKVNRERKEAKRSSPGPSEKRKYEGKMKLYVIGGIILLASVFVFYNMR